MTVRSFNHTGVIVRDLDAMVGFYTDLGMEVKARFETDATERPDHTGVLGAKRVLVFVGFEEGHQLELVHFLDPPATDEPIDKHQLGAMHICLDVDNLAELHADLSARGIRFVTEPIFDTMPDGGEWGVVYCRDPEGNIVEFIQL